MGLIERFGRAARNPRLFARGMNRLFYRRVGLRHENPEGIDVFDEDWDTLVVLDACRFDMFEQVNHLDGTVTARESKGSATAEWLQANVDGRALRDTVYVTSNPQLERNRDSWDVSFHHVDNVWFDHGWDKETGTVLAETMTEAAINAYEQFPNKRLVVHYMQPHYPFVPADTDFDKTHLDSIESGDDTATGENVWNMKFMGQIDMSRNELWDVYTANLEYVLEHVEDLQRRYRVNLSSPLTTETTSVNERFRFQFGSMATHEDSTTRLSSVYRGSSGQMARDGLSVTALLTSVRRLSRRRWSLTDYRTSDIRSSPGCQSVVLDNLAKPPARPNVMNHPTCSGLDIELTNEYIEKYTQNEKTTAHRSWFNCDCVM
ncbi:hypothetical protein [Halovenus salina]|uniref:Sulfatase n=1 Tax=Halovenus salina TaxID=1510225 RepID=A0ABD5W036_9EURY